MAKGITRSRIVEAALDVLDAAGIDAVTVRAVAQRLDAKAPALYWHVRNKQELLDEMGTEIQRRVQSRFAAAGPTGDAREDLAIYARELRAEYLAHRDGARTFSGTRLTDPELLRQREPWLRSWTAAGTDLATVADASEVVTAFVVGTVIEEQERRQSGDSTRYDPAARDAALGPDAPLVRASGTQRGDADAAFERQLRRVLDGVLPTPGH